MELNEKIISKMTSEEYQKNRKEIKEFYRNKRAKEKRKKESYNKKYYIKKCDTERNIKELRKREKLFIKKDINGNEINEVNILNDKFKNNVMKENHKKYVKQREKYNENKKYNSLLLREKSGKQCIGCFDFKKWNNFPCSNIFADGFGLECFDCIKYNEEIKKITKLHKKLIKNLRARINMALKGRSKSQKTKNLLGCNIEYLKKHLESQFKDGMTWDNYGVKGWHVDHINPCSLFNLADPQQQKECFHYTNLQPLWAEENLKKSNKY